MADDPRYPIGPFARRAKLTIAARQELIDTIADLPEALIASVDALSDEQLDTPYREGGWTIRQVVHHLVDSHLNAYTRMKLAVTEENPKIKGYDEAAWAEEDDARLGPVDLSVELLEALHNRWAWWLRTLNGKGFGRTLQHPEQKVMSVDDLLQLYAWHSRHHIAQINSLTSRMNW